ncbi:MAG: YggS family pyridoxal phosphate-dependent enzyme [Bacillota bacterium]
MGVQENIREVKEKIALAAGRAGRSPRDIKLVAVTKGVCGERILEALAAGINAFGENRVQEMLAKQALLPAGTEWHFIGHLQTNKVKYIINTTSLIHSLDSWRLAQTINRLAEKAQKKVAVLVQVNVAGEKTKYGLPPAEVMEFLREASALPWLKIRGLMTIAPAVANPEEARPVFRELRFLYERARALLPRAEIDYLSMGMTNDYLVAVEEGANILRLGTAIFGARKKGG